MAKVSNIQVQSGNRIIVKFDSVQVGLLQSFRVSDDYGPEPASGIGDARAVEYVPGMARHSLSVSQMLLKISSLRKLGFIPENSNEMMRGLVFDITLIDRFAPGNFILRHLLGCSYASGELEISKHQILMTSAMFNVLDVAGKGD